MSEPTVGARSLHCRLSNFSSFEVRNARAPRTYMYPEYGTVVRYVRSYVERVPAAAMYRARAGPPMDGGGGQAAKRRRTRTQ